MSVQAAPSLPGDFGSDTPQPYTENVPHNLRRATARLQFPPSYVVVGVYRFCTDKNLYVPAWKKCQHGVVRGLGVGLVWVRSCCSWVLSRLFNKLRALGCVHLQAPAMGGGAFLHEVCAVSVSRSRELTGRCVQLP